MFELVRDTMDECFATMFCAGSGRRLPTKVWFMAIGIFTSMTTFLMLLCVCTDNWEATVYDPDVLFNLTLSLPPSPTTTTNPNECTYTTVNEFGENGWYLATYKYALDADASSTTNGLGQKENAKCENKIGEVGDIQNISLVFPQRGSAFRLCLGVPDNIWSNISNLCKPMQINKCFTYDTESVKQPFCCIKCLYTREQVDDMDNDRDTAFEPIFTVIGFLIVSLIVLCVCHVLILIIFWKRIVPMVMITGILFLVSGTFMAFCLAAHQYKVEIMNTKQRSLPHMTQQMIDSATTKIGWSIDVGWMGFAFSIFTGILWIRLSYHLASESSSSNKVRPTFTILHSNSVISAAPNNANNNNNAPLIEAPQSPKPPPSPNAIAVPKSVRWAAHPQPAGRETSSTIVPNSRPDSGSNLLTNEVPTATANGGLGLQNKHPLMVEESV